MAQWRHINSNLNLSLYVLLQNFTRLMNPIFHVRKRIKSEFDNMEFQYAKLHPRLQCNFPSKLHATRQNLVRATPLP